MLISINPTFLIFPLLKGEFFYLIKRIEKRLIKDACNKKKVVCSMNP